jgi:predicted enzyme related to lactoylglutathione lyase
MEIETYDDGVPCWVDHSGPEPAKAADFYGALFGWQIFEGPEDAGGYRMCYFGEKAVAGIGPQPDPNAPSAWTTYVKASSADDASAKVQAAGGQPFMPAFDVLDVGRMFVYADNIGAVSAVWEPKAHTGAALVNEPGTFCWSELMSDDIDASSKFYADAFGWGVNRNEADGVVQYVEFQVDGRSIAGMMPRPAEVPAEVPANWLVYFAVADADEAIAKAIDLGAASIVPAMDIPIGRFGVLMDPLGAAFALIALAETPAA